MQVLRTTRLLALAAASGWSVWTLSAHAAPPSGVAPISAPQSSAPQRAGSLVDNPFWKSSAGVNNADWQATDAHQRWSGQATQTGWADSWNKMTDSVTSAFKPTPKTETAPDPLQLSGNSQPNASVYLSAAAMFEGQGQAARAIENYQKALELEPQNRAALLSLARLYDRVGQDAQAEAAYARAVEALPRDAAVLNDLGLFLARRGRVADATGPLRRAAELQPTKALYANNLAAVLVEAGQLDQAFQHLRRVHGDAAAHYNLGYLLYRRGDFPFSQAALERAVAADANLAPARALLARVASERGASSAAVEPRGSAGLATPTRAADPPNAGAVGRPATSPTGSSAANATPVRFPEVRPSAPHAAPAQGGELKPPSIDEFRDLGPERFPKPAAVDIRSPYSADRPATRPANDSLQLLPPLEPAR